MTSGFSRIGTPGIRVPDAGVDLLRRTNPLAHLGLGLPSFLIQHGFDDDLVPVAQSMLLVRMLMPETDIRFDVVPGSLQGGPAFPAEESMVRVLAFGRPRCRPSATLR